jgi:uncharacterized protein YggE
MDNNFTILISIIAFGFIVLILFSVNNFISKNSNSTLYNNSNTISVGATGTVSSAPDELTIVLSAKVDDPSSQKAVSSLAVLTSNVLNSVKKFNTESVETSSYNLYQNNYCPPCPLPLSTATSNQNATAQSSNGSPAASNGSSVASYPSIWCKPCLNNTYEASEEITIKTLNLTSGGSIVDAAVNAGANNVESVSFGFSKQKTDLLTIQALNQSVSEAEQKAQSVASNLGLKITGVQSVNINNYYYPTPFMLSAGVGASNAAATQIIPGNQTVSADVQVSFYIN